MRFVIALLLTVFTSSAFAQQPSQDPQIVVYRQLLDNANAQLVQAIVQLQQAQAKIKELEKAAQERPETK